MMPAYAATIFIGAFLLFQVQPLIAKYILPWFGGGPGVWTTCMLFFQVFLLGGYLYAHWTTRWLKPRAQAIVHAVLLGIALALLPITPGETWKPAGVEDPTWRIFGLLAASLGLPYFVLASTAPLMQRWFSHTNPGQAPYRLYALSNVGSLLALLSYPVFVETHLTRKGQAAMWGWGLALFVICCAICVARVLRLKPFKGGPEAESVAAKTGLQKPTWMHRLLWLLLPACASVLLLGTTNKMCQDVAVIPFLWVLPLALYLLSFIICFDSPRWYVRFPFLVLLVVALAAACWALPKGSGSSIYLLLGIYAAALFVCCMVCHGELYRLKPGVQHLTSYYLMIAAGGALGGVFVAVLAPLVFTDYFEVHWGLGLCGLLFLWACIADRRFPDASFPPVLRLNRLLTCGWIGAGVLLLAGGLWLQARTVSMDVVFGSRNFYGVQKVYEFSRDQPHRHHMRFMHGRTLHGLQFVEPGRAAWPTTYFGEQSGIGLALGWLPGPNRRIGVVGLGAGTLATYAQPGDSIRFYEINPEVRRLAETKFTFLSDCAGRVEHVAGDARLSLEREPSQGFDLLAIDAFNSDAIPVHLLTREAFEIYLRHLKKNGVLVVQITNQNLDLEPVVRALARHFNLHMAVVESSSDRWWIYPAAWVVLSSNEDVARSAAIAKAAQPARTDRAVPLWTDDFASLFQILRRQRPVPMAGPDLTEEHCRVAAELRGNGNIAGAIARYEVALGIEPKLPEALEPLSWLLATCEEDGLRNGPEAVRLAERLCGLTRFRTAGSVSALAAAYAEAGRFDEAMRMAERARDLASHSGERALAEKCVRMLDLFRAGKAYRESVN